MNKKHRPWLRFVTNPDEEGGNTATGETTSTDQPGEVDWKAKYESMKQHSRDWESKAKANLAELEKIKKQGSESATDFEKLQQRVDVLEKSKADADNALEAERRKNFKLTVGTKHGLSVEDLEFLPDSDDEELLEKHAKRLARSSGAESKNLGGSKGSSREAILERAKKL